MNTVIPITSADTTFFPLPSAQIDGLANGQAFQYYARPGEEKSQIDPEEAVYVKVGHDRVVLLGGPRNGGTWAPKAFDYMPRHLVVPVDLEIRVVKKS